MGPLARGWDLLSKIRFAVIVSLLGIFITLASTETVVWAVVTNTVSEFIATAVPETIAAATPTIAAQTLVDNTYVFSGIKFQIIDILITVANIHTLLCHVVSLANSFYVATLFKMLPLLAISPESE